MARGQQLAMLLRGAYLTMHRQAQQVFAPFGATADQFVLLSLLAEQDGVIQQDLVRRSFSDPNTVRAILVLLEKRGLVTRRNHQHDGRARLVHLTPKGRTLYGVLLRQSRAFHQAVAACLPAGDWDAVANCLGGIPDRMNTERACGKTGPVHRRHRA
jgi:MarR family transcriptional regulator, organic hydroperoxide resistance regulator